MCVKLRGRRTGPGHPRVHPPPQRRVGHGAVRRADRLPWHPAPRRVVLPRLHSAMRDTVPSRGRAERVRVPPAGVGAVGAGRLVVPAAAAGWRGRRPLKPARGHLQGVQGKPSASAAGRVVLLRAIGGCRGDLGGGGVDAR